MSSQLRAIDWQDDLGRNHRTLLPDDAPDEDAPMGIPIGPPDVVGHLGLPEPLATRIHNLLHERGLWSTKEVRANDGALFGVLQSALRVDVHVLFQGYIESEKTVPMRENGHR